MNNETLKPKTKRAKSFYNFVDKKGNVKQDSNSAAGEKGNEDNSFWDDKYNERGVKNLDQSTIIENFEERYSQMSQEERDHLTNQILLHAENDDIIDYNAKVEEEDAAKKAWKEYREEQREQMANESKHLLDVGKISPELLGIDSIKKIRRKKREDVTLDDAYSEDDNGYGDTNVGMRITRKIQ